MHRGDILVLDMSRPALDVELGLLDGSGVSLCKQDIDLFERQALTVSYCSG